MGLQLCFLTVAAPFHAHRRHQGLITVILRFLVMFWEVDCNIKQDLTDKPLKRHLDLHQIAQKHSFWQNFANDPGSTQKIQQKKSSRNGPRMALYGPRLGQKMAQKESKRKVKSN